MNIQKEKVVSLSYCLKLKNWEGEVIETVDKDNPLTFIFGEGQMLEHFEKNIEGLAIGDKFKFELKTEDAYGNATEEALIELPKTVFEVDGKIDENLLKVDNVIPMRDQQGNILKGIVLEITEGTVKMDFNHPLAGENLFFEGEVVGVRNVEEHDMPDHECTGCGKH